ncbi:MAG TPA: sigma-70 family RNA polymerase sigma factor [Polyangiaceae bacterium]
MINSEHRGQERNEPVRPTTSSTLTVDSLSAPRAWEHRLASSAPLCSDNARLAKLLRDNYAMVWGALRRLGVSEDAADDASQEVFITAARKLAGVEPGRERPYIYGIALRVAANARRAKHRTLEYCDEDAVLATRAELPGSDHLLDEKRWREELDEILDRMPETLRTAFVLFEFEGFSEREIAELCAVPQGTAASRLRRARNAFQEAVRRLKSRLSEGELR